MRPSPLIARKQGNYVKKIILSVAAAAIAIMAVGAPAFAGVERNQERSP